MKHAFIRCWLVGLVLLSGFSRAHADSLASIFTNVTVSGGSPRLPSIIFIRCHGLGYGDLSCYGQTNFFTPNIDRLAAGGMRFTNFSAGAPDFSGALAALMTGKNGAFPSGTANLAEQLQSAGYCTGLIGEWTLGDQPWTQGFNEFAGFIKDDEGRDYYADHIWRFLPHSLFDPATKTISDYAGKEMIFANSGGQKSKYMPEVFLNTMVGFIQRNQPDKFNEHKPFFLLMDFPAPRSATNGADAFPVPSDAPYGDEPWPQAAKNRTALITRIDGGIGRLFEELAKAGMSNNVVIFFSSSAVPEKFADKKMDFLKPNGEAAPDTDPALMPLPMIAYWPGEIPAGAVSGAAWSNRDFMPTALEIARMKVQGLDGASVLPVLRGEK
jgi:arylsulfatase A-like enzyme